MNKKLTKTLNRLIIMKAPFGRYTKQNEVLYLVLITNYQSMLISKYNLYVKILNDEIL